MIRPESMSWIVRNLWLIPALPMAGGGGERAAEAVGAAFVGRAGDWVDGDFAGAVADGLRRSARGSGAPHGHVQLDAVRGSVGAAGVAAGPAGRGDAGDGELRGAADLYLQPRLHGARRQLHTILLLYVAVCGSNARGGDREQLVAVVYVLGSGRADVVSADWVLVSATGRCGGSEEGLHHHARGRPGPADRDGVALLTDRHAAFLQPGRRMSGAERSCGDGGAHHRCRDGGFDRDWAADFLRRRGQVGPGAAACVAAGCDGGPDAGERADPRGDDGGGGRVPGGPGVSADERAMHSK